MAVVSLLQPGDYTLRRDARRFSRRPVIEAFHLEAGAKRRPSPRRSSPGTSTETVTRHGRRRAGARPASGAVGRGLQRPDADDDAGREPRRRASSPGRRRAPRRRRPDRGSSGEGGTPVNVAGRARGVEQLPARRRGQQRPVPEPRARHAEPRRGAGVHAAHQQLRRPVRPQRRRAGQRRAEVGRRPHFSGSAYAFFRDRALEARGPLDPPDPSRSRSAGAAQAGGTLGRPVRRCYEASIFVASRASRDRTAEHARRATCPTAAERAGDFSASGVDGHRPLHGRAVSTGNRIPASRHRRDRRRHRRAVPAAEPRRDDGSNFVSSPIGPQDTWQVTGQDRFPPCASQSPFFVRYSFARDDARVRFPVPSENLPGYGTSHAGRGAEPRVRAHASRSARARSTTCASAGIACAATCFPINRGVDGFARLGMTGPSLHADDLGYPAISMTGSTGRRRRVAAGGARHAARCTSPTR